MIERPTKLDDLIRDLKNDPTMNNALERARQDIKAYFAEQQRRQTFVRDAIRQALIEEFVEDWNIREPGTLANTTADAILPTIMRLLQDETLTREVPISTETKVEL